jgi:hypothetical protein
MSDPLWREARLGRPYGSEPGDRPRGRDPGTPPGAPRTPPAGARTPGRDPARSDSRGSDPRGRDPGWGGRDSSLRGGGGNGRNPGSPAGRGGDPGADAPTRRMPTQPGAAQPPRSRPSGTQPTGTRSATTQPTGTLSAMTAPRGRRDGAARGASGPRDARGRRNSPRPRGPARLGALQGGLGVCIVVASAAIGAIVTMVTRSAPGLALGFFVVVGTLAASLAVRPRAGRMILPVPVLSYLVAALISGVVFDRSADSSKTALAISAAQWIADGFFAMALATALAVVIITTRWFLWRRGRSAARDSGWPVPAAGRPRTGPNPTGPARAGTVQAGPGRDGAARPPRTAWETPTESGYPAGFAGPGRPRQIEETGGSGAPGGPGAPGNPRGPGGPGAPGNSRAPGGPGNPRALGSPGGSGGSGVWSDPGTRGIGPRPSPRPGSEPYNFSSGA